MVKLIFWTITLPICYNFKYSIYVFADTGTVMWRKHYIWVIILTFVRNSKARLLLLVLLAIFKGLKKIVSKIPNKLLWVQLSKFFRITAQKQKFSIKDFSSKCDQIHSFLLIWSHLQKKSLMKNLIFVQCNNFFVRLLSGWNYL